MGKIPTTSSVQILQRMVFASFYEKSGATLQKKCVWQPLPFAAPVTPLFDKALTVQQGICPNLAGLSTNSLVPCVF
jgi:hypothetical protein